MEIVKFKDYALQMDFPPNYDKDFWDYGYFDEDKPSKCNCCAYAMQMKYHMSLSLPSYQPGFLSNLTPENSNYTKESIIEAVKADCAYLGIECTKSSLNENIRDVEAYKIAIFYQFGYFYQFHFLRQNDNLSWSEKYGWDGPIYKTDIKIPQKAGYELLSIMKLSRAKY